MNDVFRSVMSVIIACALPVISVMFDSHITGSKREYDGQTAVFVAVGNLYVIGGWAMITALWHGWEFASRSAMLLVLLMVMAGLPMYFGEIERNQKGEKRRSE